MHWVLYDLEATCWEKYSSQKMETIEIGAYLLDTRYFTVVDKFHSFVKPILNPVLSDYCKELTKITQENIDTAENFPTVYSKFVSWASQVGVRSEQPIALLASWGCYDYGQLIKDCMLHKIKFQFKHEHINVKGMFSDFTGSGMVGLNEALALRQMNFEGQPHNAIDDVRNTYRILKEITY